MLCSAARMTGFVDIAAEHDLPTGRMKAVSVDGRPVALYHTGAGWFATDNTCPHRGGPLAEGDLVGNEVTCPWHLWSFDVASGICMGNPEVRIQSHEVRVENGRILVRLR
jgi:NAD(P)H-dependent nitrite reductase small subunit